MPTGNLFSTGAKIRYADPQATRRRRMKETIKEDHRNVGRLWALAGGFGKGG
jgi:hypothetical protein